MRKVTIKDVAREAGVAISTVSNALNNSELVNEETKVRILKIAEQMNYVPNLSGRLLKSGKSKMLGFFTSSISGEYFTTLLEAMSRQCEEFGYTLNILISRDRSFIRSHILGKQFDGIFIFQGERIDRNDLELLEKQRIKAVMLDRAYESMHVGSVVFDSCQAGYQMTRYLIKMGHKRIAFIRGEDDVYDSTERQRGYREAMREAGLTIPGEYIMNGSFEELLSYNIVTMFIKNRSVKIPEAFVAADDLSAIGCMKALIDQGYRIPDDISVAGFDDISVSQYFSPKLTTIHNPINMQGISAARMLIDMVERGTPGKIEQLSGKLIVRESCAPII